MVAVLVATHFGRRGGAVGVDVGFGEAIKEGCALGKGVAIEEGCTLGSDVVVKEGCELGSDIAIKEGCALGSDVVAKEGCALGNDVFVKYGAVVGNPGGNVTFDDGGSEDKFCVELVGSNVTTFVTIVGSTDVVMIDVGIVDGIVVFNKATLVPELEGTPVGIDETTSSLSFRKFGAVFCIFFTEL